MPQSHVGKFQTKDSRMEAVLGQKRANFSLGYGSNDKKNYEVRAESDGSALEQKWQPTMYSKNQEGQARKVNWKIPS